MQTSPETRNGDPRGQKPGFHNNNFRLAMEPASNSASTTPAVPQTPCRGENKSVGTEPSLAIQPSLSLGATFASDGGPLISLMTSVFATLKEENTTLHNKVKVLQEKNRDLNDENKRLRLRQYRDYYLRHQSSGKRGRDFDKLPERQRSESMETDGHSNSSDERHGRHSELTRRKRKDPIPRSSSNESSSSFSSEISRRSHKRSSQKVTQKDASPKSNSRNFKRSRRDHETRKLTPLDHQIRSPEKAEKSRSTVPSTHERSSQPSFRNSCYNPGRPRKPWEKIAKDESPNRRFSNWSRPYSFRHQSWRRSQTLPDQQEPEERDNSSKPFFNPFSYKSPDKLKQ